jgi:hypothetical protein
MERIMVVMIKVQEYSGRKEYERKRGKRCYEQQQKKTVYFHVGNYVSAS